MFEDYVSGGTDAVVVALKLSINGGLFVIQKWENVALKSIRCKANALIDTKTV